MPKWLPPILEVMSDCIWLAFNFYFVFLSYDFVFNKMNLFWKSQTLGIPMKYIYLVLPLAFFLMSIRIIQVNYMKFIRGETVCDPETQELTELSQASGVKNG